MQDIKQQAKIMFRKLWGGINKENQHLTTEKIEDLLDTVILLAVEQEKGRAIEAIKKEQEKTRLEQFTVDTIITLINNK